VLGAKDNIILNFRRKLNKVSAKASHTDNQIFILLRICFGIEQFFGAHDIKLDVLTAIPKKGIGVNGYLFSAFRASNDGLSPYPSFKC